MSVYGYECVSAKGEMGLGAWNSLSLSLIHVLKWMREQVGGWESNHNGISERTWGWGENKGSVDQPRRQCGAAWFALETWSFNIHDQILALLFISCMTLSWWLNISELQFSHLYTKDDDSYLPGLFEDWRKWYAKYLAYNKCSVM